MNKTPILSLVLIVATLAGGWNFSVPAPPFSLDGGMRDCVAATPVVDRQAMVVGSRKIGYDNAVLKLFAHGSELFHLWVWCNCHNQTWEKVGGFATTVDADGRGVHRVFERSGQATTDGALVRFESDVRLMTNGEVRVTTFNPGSKPERGCTSFHIEFPAALWLDQFVSINGSKPFRVPPTLEEWKRAPNPADAKMHAHFIPAGATVAFFAPDGRTKRFAIRFGENIREAYLDKGNGLRVHVGYNVREPGKPANLYVDLGDTRVPREKPRLVGGVNFRDENDFDVACWDESKNLLVNGGFESGARYFKGDFRLVEDAHTGRYAMSGRVGFDSNVKTVGIVLEPETWYTIGAWIKTKDSRPGEFVFHARGTTGFSGFLDRVTLRTKGGAGWQFAQNTFRTKDCTSEVTAWMSADWQNTVVDDLCLVKGSNVVATAVNSWGMEIRTGAEDNLFVPADREDGKIQLLVRGPKGAKASLEITGGDLLGRKTIAVKTAVAIPDAGETLVDLGLDSAFPKGVNGIKVKLTPTSLPTPTTYTSLPYTDYLRFMKAKWGDNTQKLRFFQCDPNGCWFVGGLKREGAERYERRLRRNVMLGIGSIAGTTTWFPPEYPSAEERALLEKYGIVEFYGEVRGNRDWQPWINGKPWKWQGTNISDLVTYPEPLLAWVEEQTYERATNLAWRTYWSFDSEPAGHHASLKAGRFDEYAKLLTAINRGLKRANPKNELCPYGSWNMGAGTLEIAHVLKELKRIDPKTHYKYIEAHSYREYPEDPDVETDLQTFFSRLAGVGYDDIKVRIGEGSYYFPMFRPSRGMYPWTGVGGHDGYSGVVIPGYDLGVGERIGAALTTRETIVYVRHADRVYNNLSFNPRWIDDDTPCGWLLAHVALLELLGDATYLDEVRFAPKSRALLFDDGHVGTVAFIWRADAAFDQGRVASVEAEVDFGGLPVAFYDLYANRVKVRGEGEGKVVLPLSGYPIYARLPSAKAEDVGTFKRAIGEARVAADLDKLPLTCSLTLKDASTVRVTVVNTLSRTAEATVKVDGVSRGLLRLPGRATQSFEVKLAQPVGTKAYAPVKVPVEFIYEGKTFAETFETKALAVGYVADGKPDWTRVPAVELDDWFCWPGIGKHKSKAEFNATVKLAWNEKHLWMKFKVKDDLIMPVKDPKDWKSWGSDSDMINLFFDGYANGREKFKRGQKGYDFDDFAFGVFPLAANAAGFIRSRAPDHQLTGGAGYGFVVGPETNVACEFKSDAQGYEVTLDFPAYYLMPVKLEAGGVSPGFAIAVYDRDQDKYPPRKSVRNYSGPGPDEHPEAWPQLIFVK